jgi:Flp pilus assembly protein TadB
MLTALLLAWAVMAGVPWMVAGLLAVGVSQPAVGLAAVTVASAMSRRGVPAHRDGVEVEAVWCAAMAAELRAGASIRSALDAAADRVADPGLSEIGRLARAGVPVEQLAERIGAALPRVRHLAGPAVRIAAEAGGAAAGVFGRLAVRSLEQIEAERERRVATAQVRLSAGVVASLPLVVVIGLLATGRAAALAAAGPVGVAALAVGLGLLSAGMGAVWVLSRRVAT